MIKVWNRLALCAGMAVVSVTGTFVTIAPDANAAPAATKYAVQVLRGPNGVFEHYNPSHPRALHGRAWVCPQGNEDVAVGVVVFGRAPNTAYSDALILRTVSSGGNFSAPLTHGLFGFGSASGSIDVVAGRQTIQVFVSDDPTLHKVYIIPPFTIVVS